ncbi:MAG: hypothetical protein RMK84_20005 [Oscillochloridaceae bacterium]|nr:hypothetical protein [Oscillochloridaceae bacterium]
MNALPSGCRVVVRIRWVVKPGTFGAAGSSRGEKTDIFDRHGADDAVRCCAMRSAPVPAPGARRHPSRPLHTWQMPALVSHAASGNADNSATPRSQSRLIRLRLHPAGDVVRSVRQFLMDASMEGCAAGNIRA